MRSPRLRLVSFLSLLALLAVTAARPARAQDPATLHLPPDARARFAAAAAAPGLAAWQRGRMRDLAAGAAPAGARAADGTWTPLASVSRIGHSAILDPVRQRMIVFGGENGGPRADVWTLALAGAPAWTLLPTAGTPPSARRRHAAVYDPVRDRMLVFGGDDGAPCNDVWALSLGATPTWTSLTPSGTPPAPRSSASAIYDPVRDRMVVFGGDTGSLVTVADVWALSLGGSPAWTLIAPSGTPPPVRSRHGAVYDAVRDRMVVFGGDAGGGAPAGDVWALSLAGTPAWYLVAPDGAGPSGRLDAVVVLDTGRDRLVVFGGVDASGSMQDAWTLAFADSQWTAPGSITTPVSPRSAAAGIYDPTRAALIVHGGDDGWPEGDTWALSLAGDPAWSAFAPLPPSRAYASAIVDPVRQRLVVFGGLDGEVRRSDTWALALTGTPVWTQLQPLGSPPSARYRHTAIYDPVRDRMLVFGGWDGAYRNDVRALEFTGTLAWSAVTPTGTPPGGRMGHSAVYDPVRDRMLIFGGYAGGPFGQDTWALSLSGTPAWSPLGTLGELPQGREAHAAFYDPVRDRMVIAGGYPRPPDEAWALSLANVPTWSNMQPSGFPTGDTRYDMAYGYDPVRDRLVIAGGLATPGPLADAWALSLGASPAWMLLAPSGPMPDARSGHAGGFDAAGDRLVAYGGLTLAAAWNSDAWSLGWSATTAVGPPALPAGALAIAPPAPNPFAFRTTLRYALPHAGRVRLDVLDLAGRHVRTLADGERAAGEYAASWDGRDDAGALAPPAVYFVRLAADERVETRRVVRLH